MSWQAYVDTSLIGSGTIDQGAIFNSEGTSVWASSPGFSITPAEIQAVVAAFKDSSDVKKIQADGFHIAGAKMFTLRSDERSLYGKQGKQGVIIVKTKQALLVAHYPEHVQPGAAVSTVEGLADYLIGVGY